MIWQIRELHKKGISGVQVNYSHYDTKGWLTETDEPGELVARGPNIMGGYWNEAEETARVPGPDGLRTGAAEGRAVDPCRRHRSASFGDLGRVGRAHRIGAFV